MKHCVGCHRRGLLLRLNVRDLCKACADRLDRRVARKIQQVRSSLLLIESMRDTDEIVEEYGRAESKGLELARIERETFGRVSPRTETLLRTVTERRDRVLEGWAESVAAAATRQAARLERREEKENLLREAVRRLRQHEGRLQCPDNYRGRLRELSSLLVGVCAGPVGAVAGHGDRGIETAARGEDPPQRVERRRVPRRHRNFSVILSPCGTRCLAEDVSSSGILLHSSQEQHVGDFLDLRLHTAKGRYRATGIVVWSRTEGGSHTHPSSLGVAFTGGVPVAA